MIRPRVLTVWTRDQWTRDQATKIMRDTCTVRAFTFSFIFPAIQARRLVVHKAF
jgi:hypothetical protein